MTDPICSVNNCIRPVRYKRMCGAHLQRVQRHGDPQENIPLKTPPGDPWKFYLAHVYIETPQCLVWPYAASNGYGVLERDGRQYSVHHLACQAWNGPRPEGMSACHGECHLKLCFNGQHLRWGTSAENTLDQRRDGTALLGERNHAAKLTDTQVAEIRARYVKSRVRQVDLAAEYGIKQAAMSALLRGVTWRHVF